MSVYSSDADECNMRACVSGRALVDLILRDGEMRDRSSPPEQRIPQASPSPTRRPQLRGPHVASIGRLGFEGSDGIVVIDHHFGHRVALECHPVRSHHKGGECCVVAVPDGWEQASHRVSMTVLSCLMDFPVSDAPRNTAGGALSDKLLQMNRNAVRERYESSARKLRASAMKPCEEPCRGRGWRAEWGAFPRRRAGKVRCKGCRLRWHVGNE